MKRKLIIVSILAIGLAVGLVYISQIDNLERLIIKAEQAMNGKMDIYDIVFIEATDKLPVMDNSVVVFLEYISDVNATLEESQTNWEIIRPYLLELQDWDNKYFYLFIVKDGYIVIGQRCNAESLTEEDIRNTRCFTSQFYLPVPNEYTTYKND